MPLQRNPSRIIFILFFLITILYSGQASDAQEEDPDIQLLSWSPDGKTIIASISFNDLADLWSIDLQTFQATNLTKSPLIHENVPKWSPDGKLVAYQTFEFPGDLWVMYPDGSDPQNLTSDLDTFVTNFQWSEDSSQIVFSMWDFENFASAVWIVDIDTLQLTLIVESNVVNGDKYLLYDNPSWLSDGSGISLSAWDASIEKSVILIAEFENNKIAALQPIFETGFLIEDTSYSPSANQIVVSVAGEGIFEIDLVNLDGKHTAAVNEPDRNYTSPRWSPDGKYIAYLSSQKGNSQTELFLFELATKEITNLTTDVVRGWNDYHEWSPDSQRVIFMSESAGLDSLWIVDIATGELTELTINLES